MKASEIVVGQVYSVGIVGGIFATCTHAARGDYRFTPVGGGDEIVHTRASEVEPAPTVSEPTTDDSAAPHGWAEVEAGVVSPPTDEYGFESRGASSLPPDIDFDGLAEAPTSPPTVYGDDELATYESRWMAALSDTPPADVPPTSELGASEVVEVGRKVSSLPDESDNCYPDDINFDGMGASDLPSSRSSLGSGRERRPSIADVVAVARKFADATGARLTLPRLERGQSKAQPVRSTRPRWARQQAKRRLCAGVR